MQSVLSHREYRDPAAYVVSEFSFAFFPQRHSIRVWFHTEPKAFNEKITCSSRITVLKMHAGGLLLCGLLDGDLQMAKWDYSANSGKILHSLKCNENPSPISSLWVMGDSVAVGTEDGGLKLWDIETQRCYLTLNTGYDESVTAICSLSHTLYSGCASSFNAWDLQTGKPIWSRDGITLGLAPCQNFVYRIGEEQSVLGHTLDDGRVCHRLIHSTKPKSIISVDPFRSMSFSSSDAHPEWATEVITGGGTSYLNRFRIEASGGIPLEPALGPGGTNTSCLYWDGQAKTLYSASDSDRYDGKIARWKF